MMTGHWSLKIATVSSLARLILFYWSEYQKKREFNKNIVGCIYHIYVDIFGKFKVFNNFISWNCANSFQWDICTF